jgi:hypothetical protein
MGMLLWSSDKKLWTAFESMSRTMTALKGQGVLKVKGAELGLWYPPTEVRPQSPQGIVLRFQVDEALRQPNMGGRNERFKKDLNKLAELLSLHDSFFVASARPRALLSAQDGAFAWNGSQKEELERLRELLHPKYFSSVQGVDDNARVVQVVFYANAERSDASVLERRVLWRATHLFPVLAFCEIMVACEGTFGAAVAAKSALELLAHFVTGGWKEGHDPFSDAKKCEYTDLTKKIGLEPLYDKICRVVHLDEDWDVETIKDLCKQVLDAVKKSKKLQMPIEVGDDEKILTMKLPGGKFPLPDSMIGNYCLVTYQTAYDDQIWPGERKRVDHTMSWSGVSSARLTQLGFSELWAYDSPATVEVGELLTFLGEKVQQSGKGTEQQRCYHAIDSLLRTTCIASNLNNIIALGAIVRELHLTLEKLMKHEKRATEIANNLDILADDLDDDLNGFRETVHAALSSFAHPGWLIRTELLRVVFDVTDKNNKRNYEALFLTTNYSPRKAGAVHAKGSHTSVRLVHFPGHRPLHESHWRIFGKRYPKEIQKTLGLGSETTQTGEGYTVPFEAFELCRRALKKLL